MKRGKSLSYCGHSPGKSCQIRKEMTGKKYLCKWIVFFSSFFALDLSRMNYLRISLNRGYNPQS